MSIAMLLTYCCHNPMVRACIHNLLTCSVHITRKALPYDQPCATFWCETKALDLARQCEDCANHVKLSFRCCLPPLYLPWCLLTQLANTCHGLLLNGQPGSEHPIICLHQVTNLLPELCHVRMFIQQSLLPASKLSPPPLVAALLLKSCLHCPKLDLLPLNSLPLCLDDCHLCFRHLLVPRQFDVFHLHPHIVSPEPLVSSFSREVRT